MGRYPFPAVPNGWFCVAASDDLAVGEVKSVHYLDRELVVFRGEDGTARVFDAYCPHLGAHLGVGGTVCGTGLRCPFHAWRFEGDGRLVEVPDLDVPPRVSAEAFEVCERNGRVLVWHHETGAAPSYDVLSYRDDESGWTPWRSTSWTVRVHVQDLTENIIDRAHFPAVHDMAPPDDKRFEVRFDGPSMVVDQNVRVTALAEAGFEVVTRTTTCGPGLVAVEVQQGELEMLTYNTQTPVDQEMTQIGIHFSMKALPDDAATATISQMNSEVTNLQFTQDIPIWENKTYRERPIVTKVDGPITQYRRWFRQFYGDGTDDSFVG
jgi:phenylpropionate dioxygenase-like ring-hydroxylating dioxygenase large terminal subunit